MKKHARGLELFSISFLDVISCGFGAVVMLVMLAKTASVGGTEDIDRVAGLLEALAQEEKVSLELGPQLERASSALAESVERQKRVEVDLASAEQLLEELENEGRELASQVAPPAATMSAEDTDKKDPSVGGIPTGANYVIFIIDTSGSMQSIWQRVIKEIDNVLDIHPKVMGFQILNDMGGHLISAYSGKWIPDTAGRRQSALRLLRSWRAFSNSSPVEGLEKALRLYVKGRQRKVSIYIFGDEYASDSSYDEVLQTIATHNTNRVTGQPIARIHGVGFSHDETVETTARFATLMREVARQSRGTFIALD